MKSLLLSTLLIVFGIIQCFSQPTTYSDNFIPPSPTAASLGKYINNYGNSSTGAINASVPVYNLQSGLLDENISLNYTSSGFKPAEVPGWVGASWSLKVGGVITRMARGLPDDTYQYGYLNNLSNAADIDNTLRAGSAISTTLQDKIDHNQLDYQPDMYSFNVGKYSGQFYIDFTGTVRIIPYKNLVITYQRADNQDHNAIACIDSWTISTPEGETYTFSDKEWTKASATVATQPFDIQTVSSWNLTTATSMKGDYMNYHYQGTPNTFRYQEYPSQSMGLSLCTIADFSNGNLTSYATNNFSQSPTWSEVIYLSSIDTKLATVRFFTSDRSDANQIQPPGTVLNLKDQQLDSIAVYSNLNLIVPLKSYAIKYIPSPYSRATPLEFRTYAYGGNVFNKYSFQYKSGQGGAYNTTSIDYWGYYNASDNGSSFLPKTIVSAPAFNMYGQTIGSADRSPNLTLADQGILQKITYPTGGETSFEYEPHDFSYVGGATFNRNVSITIPTVNATKYYTTDDGQDSDASFTVAHSATITASCFVQINDGASCFQQDFTITVTKTFAPGTYSVFDQFLDDVIGQIDYRKIPCLYRIMLKVSGKDTYMSNIDFGGGTRLKKVISYDGISHTHDLTTTYNYRYINSSNVEQSSGSIGADPKFFYYFEIPGLSAQCGALFILRSSTVNNIPLTQGNYINYTRIEEVHEDNSKTVNYYSTYNDYADQQSEYQIPFNHNLGPATKQDYLRGNLLKTEIYNSDKVLLTETDNTFTISPLNYSTQYFWSFLPHNVPTLSNPVIQFISANREQSIWFYLSQKKNIQYNPSGMMTITHDYYYDNPSNLLLTRDVTTKSDGKVLTNVNIYGDQYSPLNAVTNGATKPIEQVSYQTDGSVTKIVGGSINEYKSGSLFSKSYKLNTSMPIDLPSFKFSPNSTGQLPYPSSSGSYNKDSRYSEEISYDVYDDIGNPLVATQKGGKSTGYLWGYNKSYPVAECKNASNTEFYYEGFEESTVSGLQTNGGHTGHNYINGNYTVTWAPPSGNTRSYVISYWYKNSSTGLWTFQTEQAYTAGMTLSNGTAYDDIRICPADAQMTTYTYDPLVGMTSSTDTKGQTTYYEYDSFQRLVNVRDKDGNILKHTDYHYQNQ